MSPPTDALQQTQATQGHTHLELGLHPSYGPADVAYALIKQTYTIDPARRRCVPAEAEPLYWDVRVEEPRVKPRSDYWIKKLMTDVIVDGSACAPRGRRVTRMTTRVSVAGVEKRIIVHGDRVVGWTTGGRPQLVPQPRSPKSP